MPAPLKKFNAITVSSTPPAFTDHILGVKSLTTDSLFTVGQIATAVRNSQQTKTANYTIVNSDSGSLIGLGGSTFFTVTFNAATSYDSNFLVYLCNTDSGRGKAIDLDGTKYMCWPLQNALVFRIGSEWRIDKPARWKHPGGSLTFNCHAGLGTDTQFATDGLATGASAFQTVSYALGFLYDQLDFSMLNETQCKVLLGANDSANVHHSPHSMPPGCSGRANMMIDGGGFTMSGGIGLFFKTAYLTIVNTTFTTQGINCTEGANCIIGDVGGGLSGVVFGSCPGERHIYLTGEQSKFVAFGSYHISGGAGWHCNCVFSAWGGAPEIIFDNDVTFTNPVVEVVQGRAEITGTTWTLGGHTVTGTAYNVSQNGVIEGASAIPGTVAGGSSSGGQAL